jgi:hypothetical protein
MNNARVISYGEDFGFEILTDGSGALRGFDFQRNSQCKTPVIFSQNVWYQVAITVQSGIQFIYVNSVLQATNQAGIASYSYHLQFGQKSQNGDGFWGGSIDDARFYNRSLPANEVAYLYFQESQATLQPPQILSASLTGVGFNLNLTGLPGQNYILQSTTNLMPPINWQPVLTNTTDTNGNWQYIDTNLNAPQKFYRTTTP